MPRKKTNDSRSKRAGDPNVIGLHAEVLEQPITDTLEFNYMPYAMSIIVSRAIPEIDGFKPSHRKLLYTMYTMGLLRGGRVKSANIVGQTMHLNPHGDAAIYETMVRLSKGYGALLTPFVDSKGNFGKVYSRDMAYAASRYTEAKLADICSELFRDIDHDTVDFVDNYDNSCKEPTLLPTTFPNILVSSNQGIAVGMASMICGFNLREVCQTAVEYIKDNDCDLMATLKAPDFPTGGEIIFNPDDMKAIYDTGRGSFKIRSRWRYIKELNLIEVFEIPYTTTVEAIMAKVSELIKLGKVREISDMRDETDLNGLKLAIDLKRGVNPETLMQKLFSMTPLMDTFSCNFNILIAGMPRVMGIREILQEWTAWRVESTRRRIFYELTKAKEKLHLLLGLEKILLDIDKAISIIRNTEAESEVIPNLMIGFGIDQIQAEYVAEIRLRNINREYILKRTNEIEQLQNDIAELESTLNDRKKLHNIIIGELRAVEKKFGEDRRSGIVFENDIASYQEDDHTSDYPVTLFLSKEGYFKKITPQSLRMNSEQKYKENDGLLSSAEATNRSELMLFTDRQQVYKVRISDFEDTKASSLGTYLPSYLEFDKEENIVFMLVPGDYSGHLLFFFENGKAAKVPLESYATKTNRRKLIGAYSDKSPLVSMLFLREDCEIATYSSDGRAILFNTALLAPKVSRTTQGVIVMTLKKGRSLTLALPASETPIKNASRYRVRKLPSSGALVREEDAGELQLSFLK